MAKGAKEQDAEIALNELKEKAPQFFNDFIKSNKDSINN